MGDAKQGEQGVRKLLGFRFHPVLDDARNEDIFPHGEPVEQHEVLKDKTQLFIADLSQGVLLQPLEVLAAQRDRSLLKRDIAGDAVEQCALARAGRPHHSDELLIGDGQIDAL